MYDRDSLNENYYKNIRMKKTRITLTEEELKYLEHILWHFTDYMGYDDRPGHGLSVLKEYREFSEDKKRVINILAGRLRRTWRKLINNSDGKGLQDSNEKGRTG